VDTGTPSLKWQKVKFAKDADVICYCVTAMPKGSVFSTSEGGHSSLVGTESDPHIIGSAKVLIKTLSAEGDSVSDEEIKSVCLHEASPATKVTGADVTSPTIASSRLTSSSENDNCRRNCRKRRFIRHLPTILLSGTIRKHIKSVDADISAQIFQTLGRGRGLNRLRFAQSH